MVRPQADQYGVPGAVLAAYAAPVAASTFFVMPSTTILPGLYAAQLGVPLASLAGAILFVRILDALTDPVVGHWSDRARARGGSRKTFVVAGGVLMPACAWMLYSPPEGAGVGWFTTWFLLLYLAWTLFEIPHSAWGSEIAPDYRDRARLYTFRAVAYYAGSLLYFAVPLLPIFPSSEMSLETLRFGVIGISLLLAGLLVALWRVVPEGQTVPPPSRNSFGALAASVTGNRPLHLFIGAYLLAGIGFGMWGGLLFVFIGSYLGLAERAAVIFLAATPVALAGLPFWYRVVARLGKARAWAISMLGMLVAIVASGLLAPGAEAFLPLLAATIAIFFFASCQAAVAPAILGDIADYGAWKFRANRAATYFALFALGTKAMAGVGAALGLGLAGWFGFDPAAGTHDPGAVRGLRLAFAWIPAAILLASVPLILATPIDARRQEILRRALTRRAVVRDVHG